MSIIYDALQKAQKRINLDSKVNKSRPKLFLAYVLVAGLGFFIANFFFGFLAKPINTHDNIVAKTQTIPEAPMPEVALPKETKVTPVTDQTPKESLPSLVLNGVFFSQDKGYALINNQIVKEGDMIGGSEVVRITLDEVELETAGSTFKLSNKK